MAKYRLEFLSRSTGKPYSQRPPKSRWDKAFLALLDSKGTVRREFKNIKLGITNIRKLSKVLKESPNLKSFDNNLQSYFPKIVPPRFELVAINSKTGYIYKKREPKKFQKVFYGILNSKNKKYYLIKIPDEYREFSLSKLQNYSKTKFNRLKKQVAKAQGNQFVLYLNTSGQIVPPKMADRNDKPKLAGILMTSSGKVKRWLTSTFLPLDRFEFIDHRKFLFVLKLRKLTKNIVVTGETIKDTLRNIQIEIGEKAVKKLYKQGYIIRVNYQGKFFDGGEAVKIIGSVDLKGNLFNLQLNLSKAIVEQLSKYGFRFTSLSALRKLDADNKEFSFNKRTIRQRVKDRLTQRENLRGMIKRNKLEKIRGDFILNLEIDAIK